MKRLLLENKLKKVFKYSPLQAAEREALEKAQERELRRQKEELMNGKVSFRYFERLVQNAKECKEKKKNKRRS